MSFWAEFFSLSYKIGIILTYILYSASFFSSVFYSFYLCQTKNKNWRLKIMILAMMVYAASLIAANFFVNLGNYTKAVILSAFAFSF
jgi:hypothetical protein